MKHILILALAFFHLSLFASDATDIGCTRYLTAIAIDWLKHYHTNQTDRPFIGTEFDFQPTLPRDKTTGTYLLENSKDGLTVYTDEGSTKIGGRNCQPSSKNIKNRLKDIMDIIYKKDPELNALSDDWKFQDNHKKAILECKRGGDPILSQAVGGFFPSYKDSNQKAVQ